MRHEFDELAMSLTNGESRRTIVRKLAAGALGAFGLISLATDEADANGAGIMPPPRKKKPKRKKNRRVKCAAGRQRCGKRCCRRNQVCRQGKCRQKPKRKPDTPGCTPISQDEACAGRQCGTADDGCGNTYDCGPNEGLCPAQEECRTAPVCNDDGQCVSQPTNQGGICNNGAGMCVDGTCAATNTNPNVTCEGRSPCDEPLTCGDGCVCYSSVEGAGFCIKQDEAQCYDPSVRPQCETSDECGAGSICAPLEQDGGICCPGRTVPGFCVPLSAACNA